MPSPGAIQAADTMDSDQQCEANDTSSIYKNHPLRADTTRVVHIVPPEKYNGTDTISLRLSVISLDPPSEYRAVSYVWGEPGVTETILVDGNRVGIRINLWNFLAQMCEEGYRGALWIDAICINQNDLGERSQQVAVMGKIYSEAVDVRAWLGAGTAQSWLGMKRLNEMDWQNLHKIFGMAGFDNKEDYDHQGSGPPLLTTDRKEDYNHQLFSATTNEFLAPILEVLDLPYWSRVWIIQEFILAQNLTIQWGSYYTTVETLRNFSMCMGIAKDALRKANNMANSKSFQDWLDTRDLVRDYFRPAEGCKYRATWLMYESQNRSFFDTAQGIDAFADLIKHMSRFDCADFRDCIYAVRSLNKPAFKNIIPDYTTSRLQLFLDVAALLAIGYKPAEWFGRQNIHEAAVSLHARLQLGWECEEVRNALAAVPHPRTKIP